MNACDWWRRISSLVPAKDHRRKHTVHEIYTTPVSSLTSWPMFRLQKKRDQELLQQQKAAAIQAREELKLIKARQINARRLARADARLLREKQRADEAAERAVSQAARKAAKRL